MNVFSHGLFNFSLEEAGMNITLKTCKPSVSRVSKIKEWGKKEDGLDNPTPSYISWPFSYISDTRSAFITAEGICSYKTTDSETETSMPCSSSRWLLLLDAMQIKTVLEKPEEYLGLLFLLLIRTPERKLTRHSSLDDLPFPSRRYTVVIVGSDTITWEISQVGCYTECSWIYS